MAVATGRSNRQGAAAAAEQAPPSAFAPFRHLAFAVPWSATVVSNIGTWMHEVASGWLMTSLSPSPVLVALVQTATTLPVFLFALPAGALADIVDRRRLLLTVQAALAVVALNSVGINLSRAVGPALAGAAIAAVGIWLPFLLNAVSFLCVIAALVWWRPAASPARRLPPEHLFAAVRAGLRYVRSSGPMRATLARAVAFFLFASAYWALLPLIARQLLDGGPTLYGLLLGSVGAGAVAGALYLPRIRARLGPDRMVAAGTLGTALTLVAFALLREPWVALAMSALAGACWIAVLSSLHVSVQTALPEWVRARGLSVFVTVFFGAMSLGSLVWGQAASFAGLPAALLAAAAGAVALIPLSLRWPLGQGEALDLAPALNWPAPTLAIEPEAERGPVLMTVEYVVDPAETAAFLAALRAFAGERRRDGAYGWGVYEDLAEPGRFIETFYVETWLEHQRQHERVTRADAELQERVRAFHRGPAGPRVRHCIAP